MQLISLRAHVQLSTSWHHRIIASLHHVQCTVQRSPPIIHPTHTYSLYYRSPLCKYAPVGGTLHFFTTLHLSVSIYLAHTARSPLYTACNRNLAQLPPYPRLVKQSRLLKKEHPTRV